MFLVPKTRLTLCSPRHCSPPGSSVHGIVQARILEWVASSFSGDLPGLGIEPKSPAAEPPGKHQGSPYRSLQEGVSVTSANGTEELNHGDSVRQVSLTVRMQTQTSLISEPELLPARL